MNNETAQQGPEKLDLGILLHDCLMMARRIWWVAAALIVLFSGLLCLRTKLSYSPVYQAEATFTVYVGNPMQSGIRGYNTATAEQMAKTFPYILTSGALQDVVKRDLGLPALPAISADVVSNTNIFKLTVRGSQPQMVYDVLNSVMKHYPDVAEFVVGPTKMSLLDDSGVPTAPSNSASYGGAVKKGVVLGIGLWAVLVLVLAMSRSTIHNEEELKRLISLRCVGVLPMIKGLRRSGAETCPVVSDDGRFREFSESVRLMRMRVEKEMESQNAKTLLVTSATPSEGKTTVAINIATALARKGKRTLLVDCDLRNPSVAKNMGVENKNGVVDLLEGKIKPAEALCTTDVENLELIVAGGPVNDSSELLGSRMGRELLEKGKAKYDYVILDTPPSSLLADASEVAVAADAALLVIRQNYAPKSQIVEGARLMAEAGLHMVGCVMNYSSRSALSGKSGYYGYGYGYGYGGYSHYGHYGHYGSQESDRRSSAGTGRREHH